MKSFFKVIAFVAAVMCGTIAYGQDIDAMEAAMKENVAWLASPQRMGRGAGTEQEKEVAAYLYSKLQAAGAVMLSPVEGDDFFIAQQPDTLHSRNVIGIVEGYDPKLKNEYILIGAHYDHLGAAAINRNGESENMVFPGADDNASGVATVLEVAKMVSSGHFMFRRSVIFAFFGSNELGMAGSWYFLNRSFGEVENIVAMINLDMVGRSGRDNSMQVFVAGLNKEMTAIANKLSGRALSIAPEQTYTDYFPSDHRNFYEKGIPSVMFTSGVHRDYRTVRDTPDKLDYNQMARLAEYVYSMALELSDRDARIAMNPMQQPQQKGKEVIYSHVTVDKMATFMHGGIEKFLEKWVYEYIKYPDSAVRNGIRGTVIAEFVVDEKGKVKDVAVTSGLDDEIDAQVMKVVSASPKWKPATVGGKPVSVKISVPVEFKLAKSASFKIKK
jgi:TonB family protein